MTAEIPEGLADGIAPGAIAIPPVDLEKLETAAEGIKNVGQDIFDIGQDIKSDWAGLAAFYSAPEEDVLFEAVDPVATKGTQVQSAATVIGDALLAFADEVRPILARWESLKDDATAMQEHIAGNAEWDKDEAKVEEFNTLNNDLIKVQNDFMAAERDCANKITALFGGTTFVAVEPGTDPDLGPDTQGYGYTEAPRDAATPWAVPQQHDAAWYVDVGSAVGDFAWAFVTDPASSIGAYHPATDTWTADADQMLANAGEFWYGTAVGAMSLMGVSVENGLGFQSLEATGAAWADMAHAFFPWTELEDRPGYAGTTAGLNITADVIALASIASGVGAPAGIALLARKGFGALRTLNTVGDGPAPGGPDIDVRRPDLDVELPGPRTGAATGAALDGAPDLEMPAPGSGLPTAQELQRFLDTTELYANNEQHPDIPQTTPEAARPATREPALVGAPEYDIQANADDPTPTNRPRHDDTEDTPTQTEQPRPQPTAKPPSTGPEIPLGREGAASPTGAGGGDGLDGTDDMPSAGDQLSAEEPVFPAEGEREEERQEDRYPAEAIHGDGPPSRDDVRPARVVDIEKFEEVDFGWTDSNGYWYDNRGTPYVSSPEFVQAADRYEKIRNLDGDVEEIADRTGYSADLISRIKNHLFCQTHDVAVGPGRVNHAYFSPMYEVADLWLKAAGELKSTAVDMEKFRRLIVHEGVESRLMEEGIPYISDHPSAFSDGMSRPTFDHFGAHNMAPDVRRVPSYNHYAAMGREPVEFELADDLSNLDDLVEVIKEEFFGG
ncbi:hypothetical protein [Streptomonospora nanhaiensis]|uniref:hypothetical protein n=1 Tax=Streptomonospora nanhaiensis TaxID=1323731 RepID=UPI001C38F114|nr:hypothetical protein [Streptomonospora nanhaiensis]MBV2363948.1 hypothetical protein [Streptomonospora nanhaiensis]